MSAKGLLYLIFLFIFYYTFIIHRVKLKANYYKIKQAIINTPLKKKSALKLILRALLRIINYYLTETFSITSATLTIYAP